MADTEVAGAFAPTAASTTTGHGITHGVIPWYSSGTHREAASHFHCRHGTGKCHPVNRRNESRWRSQSQTTKELEFSKSLAMVSAYENDLTPVIRSETRN